MVAIHPKMNSEKTAPWTLKCSKACTSEYSSTLWEFALKYLSIHNVSWILLSNTNKSTTKMYQVLKAFYNHTTLIFEFISNIYVIYVNLAFLKRKLLKL